MKIYISLFIAFLLLSCSSADIDNQTRIEEKDSIADSIQSKPKLLSFSFLAADNPYELIEDVRGEIIGDSVVECWCHHLMNSKILTPKIEWRGQKVELNGISFDSSAHVDFSKPVSLTISNNTESKLYKVYLHSFTGLPVMWIETDDRVPVESKEEYVHARMRLVEDVVTRSAGDVLESELSIKGHGNSTWLYPEKKPYRLKFNQKVSLLGEQADKSWILLANHFDNTMLRNSVVFYFGNLSKLEYTPKSHFVELILNGKYRGTYQLTEKIKVSKHRLNIGNDGFLLEVDNRLSADEVGFTTPLLPRPVRIHEPDVNPNDSAYNYIKDYVNQAENALYSDSFLDTSEGYKKYLDVASFAEWYVITEIVENSSATDNWYMYLEKDGKLKMGPLWDYDLSLGNIQDPPRANQLVFHMNHVAWFSQLVKDPEFISIAKERFSFFYSHRYEVYSFINDNAQYLKYSIIENDNLWNRLYNNPFTPVPSTLNIWGSYLNEVENLKEKLDFRLEWLKTQFDKM